MRQLILSLVAFAIFALCTGACSGWEARSTVLAGESYPAANKSARCAAATEIYCDIPPFENLTAGVCAHLQRYIAGRRIGDETIQRVVSCEAPVISVASKLGTAAAVAASLDVDGPPSHGAFLFVRFDNGWHLVDHLLDPAWNHGGYCKTRFQLRWQRYGKTTEAILDAVSERVCHMPLDQREIAAGESDIAASECRRLRYGLANGKLAKRTENASDETCTFR